MRFSKIYEMILDLPIVETAIHYRDACNHIRGLVTQIHLHVLKLILIGQETPHSEHWRDEITGWLKQSTNISVKNKIKIDYFEILYVELLEDNEKRIKALVESIEKKYSKFKIKQVPADVLMQRLKEIMKDFSKMLEDDNFDNLEEYLKGL